MPRVHEIAKQLGVDSKIIIENCKNIGIEAASHMSGISDKEADQVINALRGTKRAQSDAKASEQANKEAEKPETIKSEEIKTESKGQDIEGGATEKRDRPRRPRPEGHEGAERPRRPRPEGMERPDRPPRPRPEGHDGAERPRRPRPEGMERPDRPPRPRPEGHDGAERPRRPRPEGTERPDRPPRPRPEGHEGAERPRRPRPEGTERPDRPPRPRPEGHDGTERPRRPRPEGMERPDRSPRPRPESHDGAERPRRPHPEGAERPNRPDRQEQAARPRHEGFQRHAPRPYTGEVSEQKPQPQRNEQRQDANRRPAREGGFRQPSAQKDGGFQKGGFQQRQNRPGGPPRPGQGGGGAVKLTQMTKPESRSQRNDNFKKEKAERDKRREEGQAKTAPRHGGKQTKPAKPVKQRPMPPKEEKIEITMASIPANITVKNFAEAIGKNTSLIIKTLMKNGIMANLNQEIEFEVAAKIGEQLNVLIDLEEEKDLLDEMFKEEPDNEKDLVERPPVVVVMGHVDHGKTSLLDAIRDSSVQTSEAGGITQHIGAYTTQINNRSITFLDTPGHEAFTAMRMRGASITDIAILVVAADDGVMPQTIEAINHAKAAGVEIIIAINKIDKPSGNPDRVKQELTEHGLLVEEWGGDTVCVHVSALKKMGLDRLLEMILLVADIKELKANPNKRAKGTVVEALLDKGRGPVATVLIQEGTLNVGDSIVAGSCYGKVRAMIDDKGKRVKKAGPSKPVEILGLSEAPKAGDTLYAAENDRQARQITEALIAKDRVDMTRASVQKISLDDLFNQIKAGNVKDLNIVIKADVQGSVEAVKQSLERLSNEEVKIKTIHGGVGAITESDVMLAAASNAIIIGFNVRPEATAKGVADVQNVDIRLYRVIYNAIEDINAAIKGMLDPVYEEKVIGHAEIRQVFKASGIGTIGGSYVTDGKFVRSGKVRIMRDSVVIYEGELESLKRFKDDVKEVASGYECGLLFNKFNDIKVGDVVEAYVMEEIER